MAYLIHHGIKGQKWGVRRYQNEDGTLTTLGKKRYSVKETDEESDARFKREIVDPLNEYFKNPKYYDNWDEQPDFLKTVNAAEAFNYNSYYNPGDGFLDMAFKGKDREDIDKYLKTYSDLNSKRKTEYEKAEEKTNRKYRQIENTKKYKKYTDQLKELDKEFNDVYDKNFGKGYSPEALKHPEIVALMDKEDSVRKLRRELMKPVDKYRDKQRAIDEKYTQKFYGMELNRLGYKDTENARKMLERAMGRVHV